MADKKRKYLLFKKDDGRPDHMKPCAFFASEAGCKNGSKCKFSHDPDIMAGASEPSTAHSPAPTYSEPVSRVDETPKNDKKKRRTNDFMDEAPSHVQTHSLPAFVPYHQQAPQPSKESEELRLLREQLQLQQKQLELLQRASAPQPVAQVPRAAPVAPAAPVSNANSAKKEKKPVKEHEPSTGSKLGHGNLFPTNFNQATAFSNMPIAAFEPVKPVAPVPAPVVQAPKREVKYESSSDDEEFLFKAVNHALSSGRTEVPAATPVAAPARVAAPAQVAAPAPVPAPVQSPVQNNVSSSTSIALSTLGLSANPDAAFPFMDPASALKALETSGTTHATHGSKKKNIFASPAGKGPVKQFDPSSVNFEKIDWNQLMAKTQSHKRFKADYSFSSDQTWITARPESALPTAPRVIAIDCEMCETADPVTGEKDKNSLIRFSVVNGLNPSQVLLDTLVQPVMPVTDLRTKIHGITEEQLANVKFTLRHAQAALYNLINDQTIILGHSVHNDLKALHFSHSRCVDTAYLISIENEPESMPSLRAVAEQVLGFQLGESHDSVKDACTSLYAAVYAAQNSNVTIVRKGAASAGEGTLLLHRLPDYCKEDHVLRVLIAYTNIVPTKVAPIMKGEGSSSEPVGKTTVYFSSQQHAELAFESISGPLRPDKQNKPQKRIYLKGGGYIYVRK